MNCSTVVRGVANDFCADVVKAGVKAFVLVNRYRPEVTAQCRILRHTHDIHELGRRGLLEGQVYAGHPAHLRSQLRLKNCIESRSWNRRPHLAGLLQDHAAIDHENLPGHVIGCW
jgi:hypothetical protein